MKYCALCHAELVENSLFCGNCGTAINVLADGFTRMSMPGKAPVTPAFPVSPAPPLSSNPGQYSQQYAPGESNIPTLPISEEEEERRRRAAMMGLGLLSAVQQGNGAPMVQGTPQIGGVPTVQGTPQVQSGSFQNAQPGPQSGAIQVAPHTPPIHTPVSPTPPIHSSPTLTLHHHPQGGSPSGSSGSAPKPGCGPGLIITAIIIPIVIIASIIGLGLTIFAPDITLSGSTSVSMGASLT
ncbi:MAG TPA: zinc ribbon domain-containing protein, partial [Ktedonobacteraceae bacterium]|nr:zinc ribbon domain-containing protein [Ktedonobacteraceae bacterium]